MDLGRVEAASWMVERRQEEDGSLYTVIVWWVRVVFEGLRVQFDHVHTDEGLLAHGDVVPASVAGLAARVERAVEDGDVDLEHFRSSKHWSEGRFETREESLAPFGSDWQLEQEDRQQAGW